MCFFSKTHSYGKRKTLQSDFSVGYSTQFTLQDALKILDKESLFFIQ
jgi:hypothetical protein